MADVLRVGIIGAGRAGQCHATAFSRLSGVEVVAVWNRTRSRSEEFAARFDQTTVKVYDEWQELIEHGDVDVVSIATVPTLRLAPFAFALRHQKHVLIEKPLALHVAEARSIAAAAEEAQTVTAICFNWRYSPGCLTLWRAVRDGQIGQPLDLCTEWRLRSGPLLPTWNVGGAMREVGSHEFDRARFLTRWNFERVVSSLTTPNYRSKIPADTSTFVIAQMSDAGHAAFRFTLTPGQPERRVTICGDEGTLTLSSDWRSVPVDGHLDRVLTLSDETRVIRQRAEEPDPVEIEIAESDRQPPGVLSGQHTWNRLVEDFVAALRANDLRHETVPHLAHVSEGLASLCVIDACERSYAEKRWVDFEAFYKSCTRNSGNPPVG